MHSAGFKCESGASAASAGIANGVAAVAAVPEPETYAMMLAGLGLLGTWRDAESSKPHNPVQQTLENSRFGGFFLALSATAKINP
jgi:hypothetical protein